MIFEGFFAAFWFLYFQVGLVYSSPADHKKDIVKEVVFILEILHASSFCSSFAPQPTVVVSTTTTLLTTTPTTTTLLVTNTESFTASVTETVISTSVVVIENTDILSSTTTPTSTSTIIIPAFSTTTHTVTATTNIVIPLGGAKLKARGIPSQLLRYERAIISSACHIYVHAPTRTTTLKQTQTLASTVDVTSTAIQSITPVTNTILVSTTFTTYTTSITTTSTTITAPALIQTFMTTTTVPTATTITLSTITHTYSIALVTTGCGDIVYYDNLQDYTVTQDQCLDFCDSSAGCESVSLQCSADEPCECSVNHVPYNPGDYQCALPTLYYGPITVYNYIS